MSDRSGAENDDHWQTPQWLYDKLNQEFNFDFDPCPLYANFDGLSIEWGKSNFINPPYNRVDKPKFIDKAYKESKKGKTCVMLIPAATSTEAFHDIIMPHAEIRFLRGRIAFIPADKPRNYIFPRGEKAGKGKHDSMIVIFRS